MNKYRKGKRVENVLQLVSLLDEGRWIYLRGIPKHPAILQSMTLRTLRLFVQGSGLFVAELNKEGIEE